MTLTHYLPGHAFHETIRLAVTREIIQIVLVTETAIAGGWW